MAFAWRACFVFGQKGLQEDKMRYKKVIELTCQLGIHIETLVIFDVPEIGAFAKVLIFPTMPINFHLAALHQV